MSESDSGHSSTAPRERREQAPDAGAERRPGLGTLTTESMPDLRDRAGRLLGRERRNHTLTPTALVHEAFVRLAGQRKRDWDGSESFLASAVVMMKRVLSNHGRERRALKRGGGRSRSGLDVESVERSDVASEPDAVRLALKDLHDRDPRMATIVEMRLYRGLSCRLVAEMLDLSQRTVEREWTAGRSWLLAELHEESDA